MTILGLMLKIMSGICFLVFGLWAFLIDLSILNQVLGFWGVVIAFLLLPVAFVAAPWYALVAWGNPLPLIVGYGGGILALILYGIGSFLAKD